MSDKWGLPDDGHPYTHAGGRELPSAQPDLRGLAESQWKPGCERALGISAVILAMSDAEWWNACRVQKIGQPITRAEAAATLTALVRAIVDNAALAGPEDGARSAWRPIEDEMPEEGARVMIAVTGYEPDIGSWVDDHWFWDNGAAIHSGTVTHWMPLPAPPGEP